MITIIKQPNGEYVLRASGNHQEAIDWLQKSFPRKLELYIEIYLDTRYANMIKQTDKEVLSKLTETEKADILSRDEPVKGKK